MFHMTFIRSELSINHTQTWIDDFAVDLTGQNGWKITKTSGYDLPNSNPFISINNSAKYHGPFPASYSLSRFIKCNTINETRLFITFRTSYCNTDRKNDLAQFSINDPLETYNALPTWNSVKLNHKDTLLDRDDLLYVQNTTANYYTGHLSSSSNIPQCSQTVTATAPIDTHLIPGEWYSSNTHNTYSLTIIGSHIFEIKIDISLSGEKDEYVIISDIAAMCIQLIVPTTMPTTHPTNTPTTNTKTPSETPTTSAPSDAPTPTNTGSISISQESLELLYTSIGGGVKQSSPEEPWCYHCALYVVFGCIGLVFCFLILMCIACIMYKKEAQKQKEAKKKALKSHMKYKARPIPKYSESGEYNNNIEMNNENVTVNIDNIMKNGNNLYYNNNNSQTESTKYTMENDEINEEEKSEINIDVESDINFMRYDEMDPNEQLHPDHKKTVNYTYTNEKNNETSDITNENEDEDENDNYEYNDDDILGINDKIIKRKKELKMVDNSSYDHLNMDEDIVDKSDSPYF